MGHGVGKSLVQNLGRDFPSTRSYQLGGRFSVTESVESVCDQGPYWYTRSVDSYTVSVKRCPVQPLVRTVTR